MRARSSGPGCTKQVTFYTVGSASLGPRSSDQRSHPATRLCYTATFRMSQIRSVLPYYRPYRRAVALGMALVVLAQAFSLLNPYLIQRAIDSMAEVGVTGTGIATWALLIVGAALLGGVARYGMRELLNGVSRRMEVDLRQNFFRHLLRLDAGFFHRWRTGDLMSRATNDLLAVRQAIGPAVMYLVNTAVGFVFALSLMLWTSHRLTLYAMIPMVLLPPVVLGFGKTIHHRFERIQSSFRSSRPWSRRA